MDILVQRKWLILLVLVLALMNLALLGIFGWKMIHKGKKPPRARQEKSLQLADLLKDELDLSEAQQDSLRMIREDFFEKEKVLSAATRAKRDSMNRLMFAAGDHDAILQELAASVADNELRMEQLRIEQAAAVKAICRPGQLKKMEGLVREIRDYLRPAVHPPDKKK